MFSVHATSAAPAQASVTAIAIVDRPQRKRKVVLERLDPTGGFTATDLRETSAERPIETVDRLAQVATRLFHTGRVVPARSHRLEHPYRVTGELTVVSQHLPRFLGPIERHCEPPRVGETVIVPSRGGDG